MTSPSDKPPAPLDYQSPAKPPRSKGWLIASWIFGGAVGIYAVLIVGGMVVDQFYGFAGAGIVGIGVLAAAAVGAKKLGTSAALAITLASLCIAMLIFGLCAGAVITHI